VTDTILPTTMIGSYPKTRWYTRYNLAGADILEWWKLEENWHAWWDATTACIKDQELAGLDIVTDGDAHFDQDVGGQSWTNYPTRHMAGFDTDAWPTIAGKGGLAFPPGHILHDYLEARVMPKIIGPVGRGKLQYTAMWKASQRLTDRPVKFGTIGPELVAFAVRDTH